MSKLEIISFIIIVIIPLTFSIWYAITEIRNNN